MKRTLLSILAVCCLIMTATGANKKDVKHQNPFLVPYTTKYGIPPFEKITYADYIPAIKAGIEQQNKEISAIVNNSAKPDFDNTVLALDNSGDIFNKVCFVYFALSESDNTHEMQKIAEVAAPMITAQNDEIYMNDGLFKRIKAVHDNAKGLDKAQSRLVDKYYKRFVRNGALLTPALKDSLKENNKKQAALELSFANNVMHEISDNVVTISNQNDLAGLPQQTIDDAAAEATKRGKAGMWIFTASGATRLAVLTYADNRDLRQKMYETYTNTASRGNEYDNSKNINQLIQLRQQKAKMLGFDSFADYAVDNVMAKTVKNAEDLLDKLWTPAIAKVKEEVADMQKYADAHGGNFKIAPWDYYYYAEKVKKEKFNFSEDEVRPYFELNSVVKNGIFYEANKLYGLTFTELKDAPKYNPQVTVYDVKDAKGKHVAIFMTDYFPRATKAQGAWMSELNSEYNYNGKSVRPIIYNVASLTPATKDTPSLLSLDEVQTVFHEFGHALQGMITNAPFHSLEGTNIDRDIVEMPSQMNEHWALVPEVLKNYAKNYKTGEVIPQALVDKLIESSKFNQGFMTTELVGAALLDIEWHKLNWCKDIDVRGFEKAVATRLNMPKEIQFRYRSPYFKHIFDNDQYSCGYYTYLWAEVLEADAFRTFEKNGGAMSTEAANSYRTNILEPGDTEDAMTLYKRFTGHEPSVDALLEDRGLK